MATTLFRWEALNYNPTSTTISSAAVAVRQVGAATSVAPVLRFSQGDTADFREWLDRNYQQGAIRVRLCYSMVSAVAGTVIFKVAVMRLEGGVTDIDADNFGPISPGSSGVPPSSGVVQYLDITAGSATLNGTVPGEQFVLRLARGTAGDGDTAAGDAEIIAIEGTET